MSSLTPTRLPEEAAPSTPVDAPAAIDGDPNNGHAAEDQADGHQSNGHDAGGTAALPVTTIRSAKSNGNGMSHVTPDKSALQAKWHVVLLSVEHIAPNPWQPRTVFDEEEMEELTQSVKAHGVQQPVIVRTAKDPATPETQAKGADTPKALSKRVPVRYELVAGERRLRASRAAGRRSIPAIVRDDLSDLQVAEMALLENVQRSNLSPVEEAKGYRRLMRDFRLSEERLSKKVGKSVQVLRDLMKLLALPEGVQQLIRVRKLSAAHGHELLKLGASPEVCGSVALYAAKATLPATALAKDPLPNSRELEKRGLIVPLDYRTRFDKAQCKSCPHKAHVASGYGAYCLMPQEWKRKQDEVIEREKDEAARVLEEARRQNDSQTRSEADGAEGQSGETEASLPLLSQLPHSSYRDLRFSEVPPGCTLDCPCRGCALAPVVKTHEGGKEEENNERETAPRVPLCLDTARFALLQKQERERREQERQRHFTERLNKAIGVLKDAWQEGRTAQVAAIAFTIFLEGRTPRGAYLARGQWEQLLERVGEQLEMEVPFALLFDEDTGDGDVLRALAGTDTPKEEEPREPLRLMLLGAGALLALEAHSAARWGGETPLLDFVLPPDKDSQTALALEGAHHPEEMGDDEWSDDEEEDSFMEEDFPSVVQSVSAPEDAAQNEPG